ncbi:MAG: MarR family transcriptional regulator [Firmicutes bacterium]|nr:MarR family transcriptional regulator [Bacillota bacterium]
MDKYDSLKLEKQLCFPLYLASKEIIRHYTPFLEKLNLTYTQYIVMLYLWEYEHTNVKKLGETLMLESNTLTPLLKKLETKKYISRTKNKNDERNIDIELTDLGKSLKDEALEVPQKMGKCINLTGEEAITLYKLVYKVLANVEGSK